MSEAAAVRKPGATLWRYRRPFRIDGLDLCVTIKSCTDGLHSELSLLGVPLASDHTPIGGPDAVRNHRLAATLPDGRRVDVEAGYVSLWNVGIAVRLDGTPVHESHPGRIIAYPDKYRQAAVDMGGRTIGEALKAGARDGAAKDGQDLGVWYRNRWAIGVDIALGLLFFVVAKLTDLTTAALVGAAAGIALVIVQRFVKVDLLGGLALFGIVMLLISAGLALAFQTDDAVKWRSTVLGLISATLFLTDGLFGGNRLGKGLMRYLPYADMHPHRLAIGMGVLGLVMAGLNLLVAELTSTDIWLFYTTFVDFFLIMGLITAVFAYARGRILAPKG